jgi:hypothetical protein
MPKSLVLLLKRCDELNQRDAMVWQMICVV